MAIKKQRIQLKLIVDEQVVDAASIEGEPAKPLSELEEKAALADAIEKACKWLNERKPAFETSPDQDKDKAVREPAEAPEAPAQPAPALLDLE